MDPSCKRLMKEFNSLKENPLDGISVVLEEDNLLQWTALIIGLSNTVFEGGKFTLSLRFPVDYPNKPPRVQFLTKMFHPNVYEDGVVCLDILKEAWLPSFEAATILASMRQFLVEPNPLSPANLKAAVLYLRQLNRYNDRVRRLVQANLRGDAEEERNILDESCPEEEEEESCASAMGMLSRDTVARLRFGQDFRRLLQLDDCAHLFNDLAMTSTNLKLTGCIVGPAESHFENRQITFSIRFSVDYPHGRTVVKFTSGDVFHPNVSGVDGTIVQGSLGDWQTYRQNRLFFLLTSIRTLLSTPNAAMIVNPIAAAAFGIRQPRNLPASLQQHLRGEAERFSSSNSLAGISAGPSIFSEDLWQAVIVGPENSPFANQIFNLAIEFPKDYPNEMPEVRFVSAIFHPNVDTTGCILPLRKLWKSSMAVADLLFELQHLLEEPDFTEDLRLEGTTDAAIQSHLVAEDVS